MIDRVAAVIPKPTRRRSRKQVLIVITTFRLTRLTNGFLGRRSLREIAPLLFASADKISGTWKTEFDTRIGVQRYAFTFMLDGDKLVGKAEAEVNGRTRQVDLKDVTLEGDNISFVELLSFGGNETRIIYTGKTIW